MEPGAVIANRFTIHALAGEGGMSIVYRATDRLSGDTVAIKVLREVDGLDPERFTRESLVLAELSHPAIVRHIAHGTLDGRPYLVMEWLDGEDLADRIERAGLSVAESLTLARRVAEALAAAHARGVVHRDIKPPNIFLPGGDVARARVVDFGIARRHRGTHAATRTGVILGTPGFMAPEQVRGERVIDARADVFSLGCVLYECLTGRPAFEGDSVVAVLARILIEDAPRVSSTRPELPEDLDELVASMLARRREDRPADAAEVIARLDALRPLTGPGVAPPLHATAALTHGERRLVCVIAASVEGDAPLVADDVQATHDRTMVSMPPAVAETTWAQLAASCGGHLEVLGGTLLVVFSGDGVARDLTARAARCALAFAQEGASPVALVTGRAELRGGWPVGEAVDRAFARVERARREGDGAAGVHLDTITASLLDGSFFVETNERGPVLKVLGAMSSIDRSELERSRSRALLGREVPCVGRERELALLTSLLGQTSGDEGAAAAVLTGPAGIGKTRLVTEFLSRARTALGEDAVTVWAVSADPVGAGAPFGLIAPMLRNAAGVFGAVNTDEARARIRRRFGPPLAQRRAPAEAASLLAWVAELAGVPFDDAEAPEVAASREDPQFMGDAMLHAWIELLDAEARSRTLVLVIDNAQWGDAVSLRFVEQALARLADRPWFVLAAARDELDEAFPKLWEHVNAQRIRLGGISRRSAERLCLAALGADADPAHVARLVEHANGSPLFLEELLRATAHGEAALPESLIAMVQSRVEAMEPEARRVLRAASVFGQVFWRGGVAALLGGRGVTPGARELGLVDDWLDELTRREIVERHTRSRVPGETEWAFRHDLLRMAAYAMLTTADRALGHGLAGAWLRASGEPNPLVLADHFQRGGRAADAAACLLDAARQALEGHELDAAAVHAEHGLTHCTSARAQGASIDETEGALRMLQTEVFLWRGTPLRAVETADEALRLLPRGSAAWFRAAGAAATARGRTDRVGELPSWIACVAPVEPADDAWDDRAEALARAAVHLYHAHDLAAGDALLDTVTRSFTAHPPGPIVEARVAGARASRATVVGALDEVEAHTLHALTAYEHAGDARNATTQRMVLGIAAVRAGRYDDAEKWLDEALAFSRRMKLSINCALSLRPLAQVYLRRGEHARALDALRECLDLLARTEQPRLVATTLAELALTYEELGDLDGAHATLRDLDASRAPAQLVDAVRARLALAAGDIPEALRLADQAAARVETDRTLVDADAAATLALLDALVAHGDTARAHHVALLGAQRLLAAASQLGTVARRRMYLDDVPSHRAILQHAARLGALDHV